MIEDISFDEGIYIAGGRRFNSGFKSKMCFQGKIIITFFPALFFENVLSRSADYM